MGETLQDTSVDMKPVGDTGQPVLADETVKSESSVEAAVQPSGGTGTNLPPRRTTTGKTAHQEAFFDADQIRNMAIRGG